MVALATARPREPLDIGALFAAHGGRVGAFVRRRTGEGAHVDDLVQETFLLAHRSAVSFRGDAEPLTWLFGIANNLCRHHVRGRSRFSGFLGRLVARTPAEATGAADELYERSEEVHAAREAIAKLPDRLREVFVLYEVEDMEGEQIALLLGVPIGTVWSRLRIARERFLTAMQRTRAKEHS